MLLKQSARRRCDPRVGWLGQLLASYIEHRRPTGTGPARACPLPQRDSGLRLPDLRRCRLRVVAGAVLLTCVTGIAGCSVVRGDDSRGTTEDSRFTTPSVEAGPVVFVSLAPGADLAVVAEHAAVDVGSVQPTGFGYYRFPVPPTVSVDEFEQRLQAAPGVVSALRDQTERIVLQ